MEQTLGVIELLVSVALFFAALLVVAFVMRIVDFVHELEFVNREIRCTAGEEQKSWKRKRRRLWLSFLPFFSK